jgi:hypothetical protein
MKRDDDGGAKNRREARALHLWRGGDDSAGYLLRVDGARSMLRLGFWGYWRAELGEAFRDSMFEAIAQMARLHAWDVLADLSRYPVQNAAVQIFHSECMKKAKITPGFRRAANLVDSTLSEMQIRRLSTESGLPLFAFFQDEQKALDWLRAQAELGTSAL